MDPEVKADAKLVIPGVDDDIALKTQTGSDGSVALDVSDLFPGHKLLALDPGLNSIGACKSAITYIDPVGDGREAVLQYRGIPIAALAEMSEPLETAYLLLYGKLPNAGELREFNAKVDRECVSHESIAKLANNLPRNLHPMAMLGSLVTSLESLSAAPTKGALEAFDQQAIRILGQMPVLCAWVHAARAGHIDEALPIPISQGGYTANYLAMIADDRPARLDPLRVEIMNKILILHADHEQNASTTVARGIISTGANPFAAVSGGIGALWGPLHGGANEKVIAMLQQIVTEGISPEAFVERAKSSKEAADRLMGFGHRVYKAYDPRATIMRSLCERFFEANQAADPLLETALKLEKLALGDPYFIEHKLYPNVDFYSGIMMKAMGIPADEFTVMFAFGRVAGWLAHAREMKLDPKTKIVRPRQLYTGELGQEYVPLADRG